VSKEHNVTIRSNAQRHTVYRYAGVENGKPKERKIGEIEFGTPPDKIPEDLAMNLTGHEFKELKARLEADQVQILNTKIATLVESLGAVTQAMQNGAVGPDAIELVAAATKAFHKACRRVSRTTQSESMDASGTSGTQTTAS